MNPEFQPVSEGIKLDDLALEASDKHAFTLPTSLVSQVESYWQSITNDQPLLHPSPLYRVTDGGESKISVASDITYKDVVGIRNTANFEKHLDEIPLALSVISFVYTIDGELVLIERSSGDWPKSMELPGAFVRPAYETDLYKQALRFLKNDLSVTGSHLEGHSLLGFFNNPLICEKMIVVRFDTNLTSTELKTMSPKKVHIITEEYEVNTHSEYFPLPLHRPSKQVLNELAYLLK